MSTPTTRIPVTTHPHWILALGTALLIAAQSLAADTNTSGDSLPAGAKFRLGSLKHRIPNGLDYADTFPDGRSLAYFDAQHNLTFTDVRTGAVKTRTRLET